MQRNMPNRQTSARARVSAGDCGCGTSERTRGTSDGTRYSFGVRERPRYYARQLMTPDDLLLEADYFRDRLRRHNVYMHGWGVVCGALVCVVKKVATAPRHSVYERRISYQSSETANQTGAVSGKPNGNGTGAETANEPWLVRVEPGYILGPYGDEIIIDQAVDVPLRGNGVSGCGSDSGDDLTDPWCSEVYIDRRTGPFYLAIRYRECPVRLVRSQPVGCGCDDVPCEYSRYRDGFEIGFLDCCPHDQAKKRWQPGKNQQGNPVCPDCPESPWVVLAEIEVETDGRVSRIDNCSCRRVMDTDRDLWRPCSGTDCDELPDGDGSHDDQGLDHTHGELHEDESAEQPPRAEERTDLESAPAEAEPEKPARNRASRARRQETPPVE